MSDLTYSITKPYIDKEFTLVGCNSSQLIPSIYHLNMNRFLLTLTMYLPNQLIIIFNKMFINNNHDYLLIHLSQISTNRSLENELQFLLCF